MGKWLPRRTFSWRAADDVDAEYRRIDSLGVTWVMQPTTQPWRTRSMLCCDPHGHLINVSSPTTR